MLNVDLYREASEQHAQARPVLSRLCMDVWQLPLSTLQITSFLSYSFLPGSILYKASSQPYIQYVWNKHKEKNLPFLPKKTKKKKQREREKESMKLNVTQRVVESMYYLGTQGWKRHGLSPLGELLEPQVEDRLTTIIENNPGPHSFTQQTLLAHFGDKSIYKDTHTNMGLDHQNIAFYDFFWIFFVFLLINMYNSII